MPTIMNPDDKAGLMTALRLKDQYGAHVTVVTMGLPKAEDVLRRLWLWEPMRAFLSLTGSSAAPIRPIFNHRGGGIRNLDYDLIITGRQAIDGDTAQVGPQIAEHLDIPVISYAEEIRIDGDYVIVKNSMRIVIMS